MTSMPSHQTSQPRPQAPTVGFSQSSSTKRMSCSVGSMPMASRRAQVEVLQVRPGSASGSPGTGSSAAAGWGSRHSGRRPGGARAAHRPPSRAWGPARAAPSPGAGCPPPPPRRRAAGSRSPDGSNSRGASGSGPETTAACLAWHGRACSQAQKKSADHRARRLLLQAAEVGTGWLSCPCAAVRLPALRHRAGRTWRGSRRCPAPGRWSTVVVVDAGALARRWLAERGRGGRGRRRVVAVVVASWPSCRSSPWCRRRGAGRGRRRSSSRRRAGSCA